LCEKAERAARKVVEVELSNASKECANCHLEELSLRDRWFSCTNCGGGLTGTAKLP